LGRLLHLSDLHFGRERPELLDPLVQLCTDLCPDITVISGDLTQRARTGQFASVAALIARLPGAVLSIPGNHDVPLYNPLARLLTPFRAFRRAIGDQLEPMLETDDLRVVGMNTADPFAWQRGVIRPAALDLACQRLRSALPGQLRVVALHHPLVQPPRSGKTTMRGASAATTALAQAGADVVLCGHLHLWAVAPYAVEEGGRRMLCVQAGTTLSTRLRGEENDLNLIEHVGSDVRITRYATQTDTPGFAPEQVTVFHQHDTAAGWRHNDPNFA